LIKKFLFERLDYYRDEHKIGTNNQLILEKYINYLINMNNKKMYRLTLIIKIKYDYHAFKLIFCN